MAKVFSHDLALQFRYVGKFGKFGFRDFSNIDDVVMQSVRRNFRVATSSEHLIKQSVMNWFRYAKDRKGGRKQRLAKKLAAENENNVSDNDDGEYDDDVQQWCWLSDELWW